MCEADASGLLWRWKNQVRHASLIKAPCLLRVLPGRAANIPASILISKGWKSWVWLAFLEGNINPMHPISREKIRSITGIPESTQRAWERGLPEGVLEKVQQFAFIESDQPEEVTGFLRDTGDHPGSFIVSNDKVGWPLPNVYHTSLSRCPIGQSRKISNAMLAKDEVASQGRLFFETVKQLDMRVRWLGSRNLSTPAEMYNRLGSRSWNVHTFYDQI